MRISSRLHLTAAARAKEFPSRVGFAALIGAAAGYSTHSVGPLWWFVAVIVTQLMSLAVSASMRRDPDVAPSRRRWMIYAASVLLCATTIAAIAPYAWFRGGPDGRLFALLVLAGGVLNVAVQAEAAPLVVWAGSVPFFLLLVGVPIVSIFVDAKPDVGAMLFVSLGAGLYVGHLIRVIFRNEAAARAERLALADAELERQRAEQASAAKSDFLATMSHEIRTPLNGVLGMAQVMAQEPLPAPQRERLEVLRQSGEVLLTLLNDLLDISRIEAAKLELDIGLLDFAGLGAQTQATFGPLLAGREVSLEISVSPDLGGLWRADANRVRQILFNLVGNAVKFTERGAISVVLRLAGDGAVVIEVADSGPGIPDDQLSRLFERFMLVDPSATRRHGGSGLGLAISRELARLMGGDISVDSAVGQGSTFTARLPLERASEAEAASLAAPEPEVQPELDAEAEAEDVHVLIAEDNKTNQLVLTTLLAQAGLSAKVVENGAEAVEAFRSGRWDVVLMDIQMPVMDGRDATRRIRELEASEGRPRTPIIAVTANAMSHQVEEYVAIGMDGLVPKPIQLEQLIGALCAALEPAANAVPA